MNIAIAQPDIEGVEVDTSRASRDQSWITIDDVSYRAGDGFDLVIPHLALLAGGKTAIVGGNGSGKTTLLKLLLGDLNADSGTIALQGAGRGLFDVAGRQALGVQLQDTGFNPVYRVRDIFAVNAACRPFVDPVILDLMGIPEIASRRFGALSSGQKQRVQLALALAHHPEFAIFDEPTSNLDPAYEAAFVELLNRLSQEVSGFTALYISHAAKVVETCDQVLILARGRVETHAALQDVVRQTFGSRAALFEAAPEVLSSIAASLPQGCVLRRGPGRLRAFGEAALTDAALSLAQTHPLTRFSSWKTCAADILEDLNNG
ncbi:ATP-binding cassette domain-containing protein [Sagittula sp. NFXS13]|uniref:ATP-binding cassette domain-containing protein n=1 Tax=Sagittula sp. NFXS13 TaxID=2819095 RepID=UPI0032DF9CDC